MHLIISLFRHIKSYKAVDSLKPQLYTSDLNLGSATSKGTFAFVWYTEDNTVKRRKARTKKINQCI